jgi:hypothetical protein
MRVSSLYFWPQHTAALKTEVIMSKQSTIVALSDATAWSWHMEECVRSRADFSPIPDGREKSKSPALPATTKVAAIAVIAMATVVSPAQAQFRGGTMMRSTPMIQSPIFRGVAPMPMAPIYRPMPGSTPMMAQPGSGFPSLPWNPTGRILRYGAGQAIINEGLPTLGRVIRGGPFTGIATGLLWPNIAR